MKKLFLMIAAVAALFATSCVQDVSADLNLGEPGVVTFAVETPQLASRAYGNADEATQLYYAVYRDGELLTAISKTKEPVELEADGKTDVSLSLASGLTYDLVFWAASPDAINGKLYSIDWANKSMKLTSNKLVASDESLDAFYYYVEPFKVEGTTSISVTLRRPFAQINVATADYELAKSAGLAVAESWFEVLGAYTTLNLETGYADNVGTLNYKVAAKPVDGEKISANNKEYDLLGVIYVLANEQSSSLNNVKFSYNRNAGEKTAVKTIEVPSAPIQRNWRTNLVGNLLTEHAGFEVEIDPILNQSDMHLGVVEVASEAQFNAAFADPEVDFIILANDVTLTTPVVRNDTALLTVSKTLTIDLNGKKLCAATPQMFAVTSSLDIKNGTVENTLVGGKIFENLDNVTITDTFATDSTGEVFYEDKNVKYDIVVESWDEFTAALANGATMIALSADITHTANYQLQKAVSINLAGNTMELPMINIHTATTVKNGTINGKVYARKNSEVVFDNVKFSGAVSDNLSTEGHLAIQPDCSVYAKDCLFSPTSVSGSQTKPLSFEGGTSTLKFENCEFKSSPYKKQVYLNSMSATASVEFLNCNFNNKTPNIMFAAAAPLTNLKMSGTTKLSSVTLEINRAKDAVTEAEWAHIKTLIANNSYSSVRVFYNATTSEYIR